MIGAAYSKKPTAPRERPFVIGAAHSPRFDSRPAVPRDDEFVIGAAANTGGRSSPARPAIRRNEPKQITRKTGRGIVIGLRHDKK